MKEKVNIIMCFLFFVLVFNLYGKNNNKIFLKEVSLYRGALDEWKFPGRYSAYNAFDGDLNTCMAEGKIDDSFVFSFLFNKKIKIDEIKIASGFFKSKRLFLSNNRLKEIRLTLHGDKALYKKKFTLRDVMELQTITLKKSYKVNYIGLIVFSSYKGSKYNDTCISEIQFFNKGKQVHISGIKSSKEKYVKEIGVKLRKLFRNKKYSYGSSYGPMVRCLSDGRMIFYPNEDTKYKKKRTWYWKVKSSRLYIKRSSTWDLVKYYIVEDGIVILNIGKTKIWQKLGPWEG